MLTEHQIQLIDILCRNVTGHTRQDGTTGEYDEKLFLKSLAFILNGNRKLLEDSVDIVDDKSEFPMIRIYKSINSARSFSKVRGSRPGTEYVCLDSFCSCPSFNQQAKSVRGAVICKHLLAIKVARALNKIEEKVLSEDKFVDYMCDEPYAN
jgi:predicted nucleic acid-binding Zn finger protein